MRSSSATNASAASAFRDSYHYALRGPPRWRQDIPTPVGPDTTGRGSCVAPQATGPAQPRRNPARGSVSRSPPPTQPLRLRRPPPQDSPRARPQGPPGLRGPTSTLPPRASRGLVSWADSTPGAGPVRCDLTPALSGARSAGPLQRSVGPYLHLEDSCLALHSPCVLLRVARPISSLPPIESGQKGWRRLAIDHASPVRQ